MHIMVGEMKRWKIGILLLLGLVLAIFVYCNSREGFQLQMMNMPYALKELYLYAPNIQSESGFVDPLKDEYDYSLAYSLEEAKAKCVSMGATLATPEQVKTATNLGATWCVAGWAMDGNRYVPVQEKCPKAKEIGTEVGNSVVLPTGKSSKLVRLGNTAPMKGYALCWGVKPPEPTVNVQQFSPTSYNMISPNLISSVMNPGSTDIYPGTFTADEANYALEMNNYNIGAAKGNNPARKYLITNIGGSGSANPDTRIYQTDPNYSEDIEKGSDSACSILADIRSKYKLKFDGLRKVFSDVSGAVVNMLGAKNENAFFAAKLQDICSQETPESSPSCMKLATLDFSLLYNVTGPTTSLLGSTAGSGDSDFNVVDSSTSRLATLEALNSFKFQREKELCEAFQRIQTIEDLISCPAASRGSIGSQCSYVNVGPTPVLQMIGLEVNAQEFLKLRLQEISPYFTTSNYTTGQYANFVSQILNKLSFTIRLPSLNDFKTTNQNFKEANDRISAIQSYFYNFS